MLAWMLSVPAALIFLLSGIIKSIDSSTFLRDLAQYRLLPRRLLRPAVFVVTGMEWVIGLALLLHFFPAFVMPISAVLLLVLASITLWGGRYRKMTDCGCYGGVVLLTPKQSALLDVVLAALLFGGWLLLGASHFTFVAIPVAITILSLGFAIGAVVAGFSRRKPLMDFSRLKAGRKWNSSWLPDHDFGQNEQFVVFMSRTCPHCKRWVPLMNVMNAQADFPSVTGVLSMESAEMEAFQQEHYIRFPLANMKRMLFSRMANAHPTAVLLRDSKIQQVWSGEIPEPYFSRVQMFLKAIYEESPKGTFSG